MKLSEFIKNHDVDLTAEQETKLKELLGIKNKKKWIPIEGERYYYFDSYGDITRQCYGDECEADDFRVATGNCFKTQEEAQFRLNQIKVYAKLKNFADEHNDEIDWKDKNGCKNKYCIVCDFDRKAKIYIAYACYVKESGTIYFSSKELAEQAIKEVGEDRIKKYLFGVEDA